MPPLGLASLASSLKAAGFHCNVLDFNVRAYREAPEELKSLWEDPASLECWSLEEFPRLLQDKMAHWVERCANHILESPHPVVGFSVHQSSLAFTLEVLKILRQEDPKRTVLMGGPEVYWLDQEMRWPVSLINRKTGKELIPREWVNAFLIGEAEESLVEVLRNIAQRKSLAGIEGVLVPEDSSGSVVRPRIIENLDALPLPTFEQFEVGDYEEPFTRPKLPVMMSRGCVGRCTFCNDFVMAKSYRSRSASKIVLEILSNMERHRVYRFQFNDLLVNGDLPLLKKVCEQLTAAGLRDRGFRWTGQALARTMTPDLLKLLCESGCTALIYGAETFSDKVLRLMDKFSTVQVMERVFRWTQEAGIHVYVNLMVGFPGETEEDFGQTLDFLSRNRSCIQSVAAFSTMTLTYGSPVERNPQKYGVKVEGEHWHRQWRMADGQNTPEIRQERQERLAGLLRELELGVVCNYAYEEAHEKQRKRLTTA
ncbi:MAG: radical SAM protein [Candidatus Omnitrophica bacterium]|nr:radical SAM protein [Candidatus Omnitrophota bacterium]